MNHMWNRLRIMDWQKNWKIRSTNTWTYRQLCYGLMGNEITYNCKPSCPKSEIPMLQPPTNQPKGPSSLVYLTAHRSPRNKAKSLFISTRRQPGNKLFWSVKFLFWDSSFQLLKPKNTASDWIWVVTLELVSLIYIIMCSTHTRYIILYPKN